jgi:hypothetical protein
MYEDMNSNTTGLILKIRQGILWKCKCSSLLEKLIVCSVHQEIPCLLWNWRGHYHIHKSLPLAPILRLIFQSTTSKTISLRFILILSSHLHVGPPIVSSVQAFQPKLCVHVSSPHVHYMPHPSHPPNSIWWRVHIMELLIMHFSPASCHFIPPRTKYSPKYWTVFLRHSYHWFHCVFVFPR